jgi:hypothetical protein
MSRPAPAGDERWPVAGIDLETRRRRVLATLNALGRTEEVAQFRRALTAATRAASEAEDYAGLEGVVQGWYLHAIALRTVPGWAERWDAVRRTPPSFDPDDARSIEDTLAEFGLPTAR